MPNVVTAEDRLHLQRALELAEGGRGKVSPNPLVGAVLVRDGEPIGEGFHARLGSPHAEVAALDDCRARGIDPAGATLYVTLEPCAHHGHQPACTGAILAAGVARVVIASEDPSEKANGRGPGILRDEGVEVELASGPVAAAARLLNQAFRKHARTTRPLVLYKAALSLDGRVASAGGDSRWISGEASRALAHRWRAECDAVCVGIGTALADDPLLTARPVAAAADVRQPTRVVFDSRARLPLGSQLVGSIGEAPLIVVVSPAAAASGSEALRKAGAEPSSATASRRPASPQRWPSSGGAGSPRSCSRAARPSPAPSSTPARSTSCGCSSLRSCSAAPPPAAGRRRGRALIADATPALAMDWERSGEDLLVRARLREW